MAKSNDIGSAARGRDKNRGLLSIIKSKLGFDKYNKSKDPNSQDTVTEEIDQSVAPDAVIGDEEKAALELEADLEQRGKGSPCPCCNGGEITSSTVEVESSRTHNVEQTKSVGASGANLGESNSVSASNAIKVPKEVYHCSEGNPRCVARLDGDVGRVGELKAEGRGPVSTKSYQSTVKKANIGLSKQNTQSRSI